MRFSNFISTCIDSQMGSSDSLFSINLARIEIFFHRPGFTTAKDSGSLAVGQASRPGRNQIMPTRRCRPGQAVQEITHKYIVLQNSTHLSDATFETFFLDLAPAGGLPSIPLKCSIYSPFGPSKGFDAYGGF